MATIIYFVRHCQHKNPKKIAVFRLPGYSLSAEGKKQAQEISGYFKDKKIAAIYSSPILRARQTAGIIASEQNLKVSLTFLLDEVKSPLQGTPLKEYPKRGLGYDERHLKSGGERIEEVFKRMINFVERILKRHPQSKVVAVSHGDPIMIYKDILIDGKPGKYVDDRKDYIPPGGIFKFVFKGKKLKSYSRVNLLTK